MLENLPGGTYNLSDYLIAVLVFNNFTSNRLPVTLRNSFRNRNYNILEVLQPVLRGWIGTWISLGKTGYSIMRLCCQVEKCYGIVLESLINYLTAHFFKQYVDTLL